MQSFQQVSNSSSCNPRGDTIPELHFISLQCHGAVKAGKPREEATLHSLQHVGPDLPEHCQEPQQICFQQPCRSKRNQEVITTVAIMTTTENRGICQSNNKKKKRRKAEYCIRHHCKHLTKKKVTYNKIKQNWPGYLLGNTVEQEDMGHKTAFVKKQSSCTNAK